MLESTGQFYGMFERPGVDVDGREVVFCDCSGQTDPARAQGEIDTLGVDHFTGPLTWHLFDA